MISACPRIVTIVPACPEKGDAWPRLSRQALAPSLAVTSNVYFPTSVAACDADWASHGGHCYKYFPVQLNYHEAESKCAEEGASAVHIANADENAFVGTLLPQAEKSWVWTSNPVDVDKYHNYWPGRRECIRFFSWVWFTNEDASDEGFFKNTPDSSQQASYVCEKEAPTGTRIG